MKRLTTRNSEGIAVLKQPYECERCGDLQWSLPDLGNGSPTDRLAEYEDIGLLPEQVIEVDRLYAEKCKELAELQKSSLSGMELAQIWAELEKLKEYRHLEEEGKLLKLPCAVGDTVYLPDDEIGYVYPVLISQIIVSNLGEGKYCVQYNGCFFNGNGDAEKDFEFETDDFSKNVFLTPEDAESALQKIYETEGSKKNE